MPRVRNRVTGLTFDVPPGHYSLTSDLFEVLPEPAPEPAAEPEKPAAKPRARKPKTK